ncbi:MAG TPA: glycosyltransferase family 4 protein [Cyclobacteriaceae bacterium]|nr:glycosyltransferase family 4 protein [Cyclobacteriaceae bacterium]
MGEIMMPHASRVVMLANAGHKPQDTRIFHKEARSLQQSGYEIVLIIPHTGDFTSDGIQVIAVPLPKKGWEQLVKCPWKIFLKALPQPRNSIFHLHDSELLMVGLALRLFGRKVIYDAHEDTPLQISYQHWIPWLIKKPYTWFYRLLEWIAGYAFNRIIVAEPVIAKYFPANKVTLIRNFPIASSFTRNVKYQDRSDSLIYVGLLSKPRGVLEMFEGHRLASQRMKVEFIVGGKFAPALLERELLSKYRIQYRSWLPYDDMIDALYQSKIGIIVPHPIERYKTNYPVKLFEYMAAGMPVIASKEGESSGFVTEADAGILVDPLNAAAIGDAIVTLLKDPVAASAMGERGRRLILDKYNWEKESVKLLNLYTSL